MNKTFPLEQISQKRSLVADWLLLQWKKHPMPRFTKIASKDPNLPRKQTAQYLGSSDATIEK